MQCSAMQCIILDMGGYLPLIYICITLYVAIKLTWCTSSLGIYS